MLSVGISGLPLDHPHSGSAVYTQALVANLESAIPSLRLRLYTRSVPWVPDSVRLRSPFAPWHARPGVRARTAKFLWENVVLPAGSALDAVDLVHVPYMGAPALSRVPVVVTVHDLIPLILPDYYRSRQAALYSRYVAWTARRAAHIITVSQHSKADIVTVLGIPESRITVTYEGADERFCPRAGEDDVWARRRYGLPDRYVLYIGSAERRKNLTTLLHAWARVRGGRTERNEILVIVARLPPPDGLYPDVAGLVRALGLERCVMLVDTVQEQDKPAVYRGALAACYPSLYEGFGLPPLEAMACGVPVLASNCSSLPEVVGNGGILLPALAVEQWAETIQDVLDSERLRVELGLRAARRGDQFSWGRMAEETAAVYRQVVGT